MRYFFGRLFLSVVFLCTGLEGLTQSPPFKLLKSSKGFYLDHKVTPKQSLFSVGRMYSVHPHFLAAYNGLDRNQGLQIDQVIRVPLTDTNFLRKRGEGVPILLYASTDVLLSDLAKFVGVGTEELTCWNKYSGTEVKKGTNWIVGFLITAELPNQIVRINCQTVIADTVVEKQPSLPTDVPIISFFQAEYEGQIQKTPAVQQLNVTSGIFRSKSGWKDGKHYLLIDNLIPGTIVRLFNPINRKEAFAKVLGEMPRIKQNEGLDVRISEAAAKYLDVSSDGSFWLQINY